jgi:hypothetical protein
MTIIKKIITHELDWNEVYPEIENFLLKRYKIKFPEKTRIRVLNKTNGMINPDRIQFRYTEEEEKEN